MANLMWIQKKAKRFKLNNPTLEDDNETETPNSNIYNDSNHIFFNSDITSDSAFKLNKELRALSISLRSDAISYGLIEPHPIYLHLTTNGGDIYSAFSVVDCISKLSLPVYTVIEGYVASAGTLISLAGEKRFINENAYMLIHELRSGISWGKMTSIDDEYSNIKKMMDHIIEYYIKRTGMSRKSLERILKKDLNWNADECIQKKLVEDRF